MVKRKNLVVLSLILTLGAMIFLTGSASSDQTNIQTRGISDTEILIGTTYPLTGPTAPYSPGVRAMDSCLKMINDQGGIHGRKIKFLIEDDAYQTAQTIAKARKLVEQNQIFAMLGNLGGPTNLAIKDYLVEKQVLLVFPQTGMTELGTPPNKYRFAAYTSYSGEIAVAVKYAVDKLKHKKIAIVYMNNEVGREGLQGGKGQMAKYGLSFAIELPTEVNTVDLASEALKLKNSGAEFVILADGIKSVATMLNEMGKIGYKRPTYVWAPGFSPTMFDLAGENFDGIFIGDFRKTFDPKDPKHAQVLKTCQKYYPNEKWEAVSNLMATGWSSSEVLAEGLQRAGRNLTQDSFIAAMETMKEWKPTFIAPVTFSPTRRQGQNSLLISKTDYKTRTFIPVSDWVSVD